MTHVDLVASHSRACPGLRSLWQFALRLNRLRGSGGEPPSATAGPFQNGLLGVGPGRVARLGPSVSRAALACALATAPACATDSAPESSASAVARGPSVPPLDLVGDAPWPSQYTADPVWVRASRGDDLERARLARREGADSMVEAVEHGGSLARVALSSLAYASDRRSARGALCGLLARTESDSRQLLLAALLDAVTDAPRSEESIDPAADASCATQLQAVAADARTNPADRDRAAAVLAQLRPR
jgi:hypothetical protein